MFQPSTNAPSQASQMPATSPIAPTTAQNTRLRSRSTAVAFASVVTGARSIFQFMGARSVRHKALSCADE